MHDLGDWTYGMVFRNLGLKVIWQTKTRKAREKSIVGQPIGKMVICPMAAENFNGELARFWEDLVNKISLLSWQKPQNLLGKKAMLIWSDPAKRSTSIPRTFLDRTDILL